MNLTNPPLAVIQRDLLDGTVPVTRMLQKCVLLANSIGSDKLREWARRELDGYPKVDAVPDYRKIHAQIQVDGQNGRFVFTGQSIGESDLPSVVREAGIGNELPLTHKLAELEDMVKSTKHIKLTLPSGDDIKKMMNYEMAKTEPFARFHSVYYSISPSTIQGVIEAIRTELASLVGEMVRVLPPDDLTPPKELADQAVHFVTTGERSTVVINTSRAAGGSTSTATIASPEAQEHESWWKRWRKRGIVVGLFTVAGAGVTVASFVGWTPWT